jgi:hypothetical protein
MSCKRYVLILVYIARSAGTMQAVLAVLRSLFLLLHKGW